MIPYRRNPYSGTQHRWAKCPYLNKYIRPGDWVPKASTQEKIDKTLKANQSLQGSVLERQELWDYQAEKQKQ